MKTLLSINHLILAEYKHIHHVVSFATEVETAGIINNAQKLYYYITFFMLLVTCNYQHIS